MSVGPTITLTMTLIAAIPPNPDPTPDRRPYPNPNTNPNPNWHPTHGHKQPQHQPGGPLLIHEPGRTGAVLVGLVSSWAATCDEQARRLADPSPNQPTRRLADHDHAGTPLGLG